MKKILYLYIATLLLAVPSVVAQVDGALTRSGEVGAYDGTRADFLTVAGKLSRYPRLSKAGEALHYAPIVTTDSVPQVAGSHDAVTVYGNVLFNGWYDALTEQGFQICTSPDFTGSTLASYPVTPVNAYVECDQPCAANLFSKTISGLTPGIVYYVRAYAANEFGTTYADSLVFMLGTGEGCPGTPIAIDHEGNEYKTVQIGYQCWTRQNMRCTTLPSGNTLTLGYVPSQGTSSAANSYYQPYYYDCSLKDTILYRGYLYNWAAAMDTVFTASTSDSYVKRRGICPAGWHVPSMDEWDYMLTYVKTHGNTDNYGCDGDSTKITKALSYDTTSWYSSTSSCAPGNDPSTNNLTEFSAYPANYFAGSGVNVLHLTDAEYVRFWTSSTYSSNNNSALYIGWDYYESQVRNSYNAKSGGFSVRCVRDVTGLHVPTVNISSVDSVTQETAKVVCEVTDMGGANEIYERGICWSLDTLPTIDNYKLVDNSGEGLGEFISRIQYLTPGATYHVRAYATNFEGVGYSADSTITLEVPANRCPGTPTVTDHEGNVYNTVQIGYQCWTRENMRCTTLPSGTEISLGRDRNGSYIRCYDTLALYYDDYASTVPLEQGGYLYNWYAVMDTVSKTASIPYVSFEKRRGICPEGWHVPSITEWDTLVSYMSRQSEYMCRVSGSSKYFANALASKYWWAKPSYSDSCYVGVNPENNNASGMSMIPTGYWGTGSMSMSNRSQYAYFWSSTLYSNSSSYNYGFRLRYDVNRVSSRSDYGDQLSRGSAFPVRCLRDTTGLYVPTVTAQVDSVGPNAAKFTANVTKDGGETVTATGFCYSVSNQTPTIYDTKIAIGSGLGEFTGITGALVPGITYYVRAYATNYEGTGYSDVMTITATIPADTCPNAPTVTDHEGNVYNTVQIGNQCWTRENMRCKTLPKTGEALQSPYSNYSNYTPYFYKSPASDSVRLYTYGYLYNWAAAMDTTGTAKITASFTNRRGICPEGWHVPSRAEWDTLVTYVGSQADYCCNGNATYLACALADQYTWQQYTNSCTPGYDPTLNNATGFTATAAGEVYRNTSYSTYMAYRNNNTEARFWTATNYPSSSSTDVGNSAYTAAIYNNVRDVRVGNSYHDTKWECHSVRCIKNAPGAVECTNPKVVTNEVSEITGSSAKFNGEVVSDGNVAETKRGFCWDYSANPDTNDYHVVCGTGAGAYETVISNLKPGYTYYVRAYAVNNLGLVYGDQVTFSTSSDFHVDTVPYVTDFTDGDAWLMNDNTNCWWTTGANNGYYTGNSLFVTKDGTTAGHYGSGSAYYLSSEKFLKMPAGDSVHVEFDALVGGYSTVCFMKVLLVPVNTNISSSNTYFGYNYSTNAANFAKYYNDSNHYYLSQTNGMAHYSVDLPNPAPNDTCKLAFLWSKSSSSNYNDNSYQPGAIVANLVVTPVVVKTESVSEITYAKATVTGSVKLSSSSATVVERGFCWSTTNNPTTSGDHIVVGNGAGSFTGNITGLDAQTIYYVSAYAIDNKGMTLYGAPVAFQTKFDKRTAHAIPYETSFEDAANWYLNNGTMKNFWNIGVINGDSSLFITDDSTTVHYNTSGYEVVMAERFLAMPQTDSVTVEFAINALKGESQDDYLKVFLVPFDQEFEALSGSNAYSSYNYSEMALQYNGNYYICYLSSPTTIKAEMLNPTPGDTAKIVFLWYQDNSVGSQPPACISSLTVKVSGDSVRTGGVSNITTSHATVGGYLPVGQTFTECGICYSTTENPTTADSKVTTGSAFTGGDFTVDLTLASSTRYYARAYVVKGGETQYGAQVTFITHAVFPFTTDFSTNQSSWVSNHGDLGDYWTIGTVNGRSAMFVTDNGTDAHYDHKATVMMEKLITMPAEDSVNVTFDVMVGGESNWDYMKVFLVTPETEFTPGSYSRSETTAPYGYGYGVNAMDFSKYAPWTTKNYTYIATYKYMLNLANDTLHISEMMANPAANGVAKLVFLWTSDGASTQPGPIIMNLSVASAGIQTVSVTGNVTNTAVMKVKLDNPNGALIDEYGVCYSTTNPEPTMADSHAAATTGTASRTYDVTMTNLVPATRYYARAYMTQGGVTIYDTVIMFYTASSLPYQTDFNDASSWYLNNLTNGSHNRWAIGDYNSGKALFITNNGTGQEFNTSGDVVVVMAERVLAMPNDSLVTVAFDVKVGGESACDYMKVILVSSDSTFTAKNNNSNRDYTFPYGYLNSSFALNFQNYKSQTDYSSYNYMLNLTKGNTLSISEKMVNPARNGAAKLVFVWTNDNSSGTQPGPIVTNLRVSTEGSSADFSCGTSKVADYEGNIYATVEIGTQCWMAENLRSTKYSDGTDISNWYNPDNNSANASVYGRLYPWADVMNGAVATDANPSGVKGICPTGWHVPSKAEFETLISTATALESGCGPARSLAAKEGWQSDGSNSCFVGYNQSLANNATGFTARPAGFVDAGPDYMNFGINANLWTTSEQTDGAYRVRIRYDEAAVNVETRQKYYGFSVRCVKDIESQATVPEVNTLGSSYYQEGDVYLMQGIVVSDGGSALTARGICYSDNNTEPTLSNSTYIPYSTTGVGTTFTVGLLAGNLTPGWTYYFRAYATNGVGTAYGETMSFVVADNLVVDSLPYDKGFTDGNSWYLNPSNNPANYWMIAVSGGTTSNALFITNDGSNAGYDEYATSEAYAVKVLYLPDVDSVTVEFDMQVGGEDSYDTLSAYLSAVGNENPRNEVLGSPSVVIITGISNTTMHVKEKVLNPAPDALAKLVFAWNNDGSATENPISAIITNLKVTVDEATGDEFTCGTSTVQDKDGNEYNTVLIGSQCWMKENLRTTTYADNTPINNDDFTSVPDNEYIVETYGYLYSWYAMMNGADTSNTNPSGVQGVCPTGWHVPSDAEFEQLRQYLIENGFGCNGNLAKTLAANTVWAVSDIPSQCTPAYSPSSNNSSGFSAYPAGYYSSLGPSFQEFPTSAIFWTCSEVNGSDVIAFFLTGSEPDAVASLRDKTTDYFSVRCVKN